MSNRPPLAIRPAPPAFPGMQSPGMNVGSNQWGYQGMPGYVWGTPMAGSSALEPAAAWQVCHHLFIVNCCFKLLSRARTRTATCNVDVSHITWHERLVMWWFKMDRTHKCCKTTCSMLSMAKLAVKSLCTWCSVVLHNSQDSPTCIF